MIQIALYTENNNGYMIDVVNRRFRQIQNEGIALDKSEALPYTEIQGTGEIGQVLTIVWDQNTITQTSPITWLQFTK